ncbi:MAG: transcription antitermination factor NusB [Clostridia bacterium]|nr:transcription antitermination factor NusB [Clostridia bacterium]NCC74887.1 transcription antitermination factor NusB [Clostridia bacterium]
MSRRESREKAFMFLYQLEIQKGDATRQLADFLTEREVGENEQDYLLTLVEGVSDHKKALDEKIAPLLKRWTIERLPRIDLTILRVAVYEMAFRTDIPANVAISEAVLLAKKYSSEESKNYINAVLGKISKLKGETGDEPAD